MPRPQTLGMSHVALYVADFAACEHFYVELMGMAVEWRPDPDNVYLSGGADNLALHRAAAGHEPQGPQSLDHIGYFVAEPEIVDQWYEYLLEAGVKMKTQPRTHRDGARSFYCFDPDGNTVQIIYHIPVMEYRKSLGLKD